MSSTSPTPPVSSTTASSLRSKKVLVPKVWKRPHSTIYGKNVEFGNKLYSDKIGEINGRKFNSELPWTMRNSGGSSTGSTSGSYNQGYLSNLLLVDPIKFGSGGGSSSISSSSSRPSSSTVSYSDMLEMTNPNRSSKRNKSKQSQSSGDNKQRIDFYDQYDLGKEIDYLHNNSLLMNEPLLNRKVFDNFLDFDHELGLFLPNYDLHDSDSSSSRYRSLTPTTSAAANAAAAAAARNNNNMMDINTKSFVPLPTITQNTKLLPKHECNLMSSPYGQSADGRKLSLGSINPQSYRPSLPQKTTTAHASDGEEIEFHDRSSPFYTDRWAGKTIRHFDSDLYSNANLFKSMIL